MPRRELYQMPVRGLCARLDPRWQPICIQIVEEEMDCILRIEFYSGKLRASLIDIGQIIGSLSKYSNEAQFCDRTSEKSRELSASYPRRDALVKLMLANAKRDQSAYVQQVGRILAGRIGRRIAHGKSTNIART